FLLAGVPVPGDTTNLGGYQRFGLAAGNRTAFREVVLPLDGQYEILVSDVSTFAGGLPTGSPDYTYNLVIDTLPPVAPTATSDGASVGGNLGTDSFRVDTSIPVGAFVDALLQVTDATGAVAGNLWFVSSGGVYVEAPAGEALIAQVDGGVTIHADFNFTTDPNATLAYTLTLAGRDVQDAPPVNTGFVDEDTGGDALSFFSFTIQENDVYRVRAEFPETSTVDTNAAGVDVFLVDQNLQAIAQCNQADFDTANAGLQVECLVFGAGAHVGTAILAFADGVDEGAEQANNQVRVSIDEATVAAPIAIGLAAPISNTSHAAPTDTSLDAWAGPWVQVAPLDLEQLEISSSGGVELNVFDSATFANESFGATTTFNTIALTGTSLLVQAVAGSGAGNFNLHLAASPTPFLTETEPNNSSGTATSLAEAVIRIGNMNAGDSDFYSIVVSDPGGALSVTLDNPASPLVPGDCQLDVLDTDGTTVLASAQFTPSFFGGAATATAFVPPGTYFARVTFLAVIQSIFGPIPGAAGGYSISWTVDTTAVAPGTCDVPTPLTLGNNSGDTSQGSSSFQPSDASCTGQDPTVYAGTEEVFSVDIPDGDTLLATATAVNQDFSPALMVLADSCSNNTCLAGADAIAPSNSVVFHNTTGALIHALLVVNGAFGDLQGPFTLTAQVVGSTCALGASQCSGSDVQSCNADGTAFDTVHCEAGCAFDSFNERAKCNPICGPGTAAPAQFCSDGSTLQVCAADGLAYVPTTCAVGDCAGDTSNGICTFGLCSDAQLGTTTCIDGDHNGDSTPDSFLLTCNADASSASFSACNNGAVCNADGVSCDNNDALQTICAAGVSTCSDGVVSACNATGDDDEQSFCTRGCNATNDGCLQIDFGDSCADAGAIAFPANVGDVTTAESDTSTATDDFDPGDQCPFGTANSPDVVTSFTATSTVSVTVVKDTFDGIMYRFEDNQCGTAVVAQCVDDLAATDTMTFTATAGTTYFIAVEPFFGTGGPFTLTVTNNG
ncbi:MAG TPA: hypothetical protein VGO62_08690, partial [Myxococcota bacterium]